MIRVLGLLLMLLPSSIRFSGAAPRGNFVEQDERIGGHQPELQAGGQAAGPGLQAGEELADPVQGDQGDYSLIPDYIYSFAVNE